MTDSELVEAVVAKTGNERFRTLLDPASPDYQPGYRATARIILGQHDAQPATLAAQAGNAVAAAGRIVGAAFAGRQIRVSNDEYLRRLAICRTCEYFERERCKICGCVASWKTRLATEHCPLSPPKW
jgi:hypothetical protein